MRARLSVLLAPVLAVAVFLLGVLFYLRELLPGWAPPGGDFANYVLPYAVYMSQAWADGRWPPLWNPDVFMGVPYLANIQASTLYPPYLLLALLPPLVVLAWVQVLHVGLAGAGMYAYALRGARLGRAGAVVAAVVFMVGPFVTGQMARVNFLYALAWAPWLMLAVDRSLVAPRWWLAPVIAGLVGLVLLAGHPQAAYFTVILMAMAGLGPLWRSVRRRRWTPAAQGLSIIIVGGALGLGLAAAQLVPTAELVGQSIRSSGVDPGVAAESPLPLRGLFGTVLPHYSSQLPAEITGASLGAAALTLALLAVLTRWRSPFVRGWLLVGLISFWAATGHAGRLYDLLYQVLPGLNLFRVPARLLLFSTVSLALLAGMGTRAAPVLARLRKPAPVLAAAGLALLPAAVVVAYGAVGSPDQRWLRLLPRPPGPPAGDLVWQVALVAGVAVALIGAAARPRLRRALAPALVGLVLADTWLATQPIYSRQAVPAASYSAATGARQLVAPEAGARYLSLSAGYAGLQPNQGMSGGWLSVDGYDGGVLPLSRYVAFRRPLLPPDSSNRSDYIFPFLTHKLYSLDRLQQTGAATVIAAEAEDPNGSDCPCLSPGEAAGGVRVWRVPDPLGRAWLETSRGRVPQRISLDRGERVEVQVEAAEPGLLVLADTDYPGWRAKLDGRPVRMERYEGLLRAVPMPAGHHVVSFAFEPASVRTGYAISLISLGILLLLAAVTVVGAPVRRPSPA
jgi:hypothetical protein